MDKTGPDNEAIRHLTYIGTLTDQIRALETSRARSVDVAREHGASWRMVGVALGTTTQAAWERFRPPAPARPQQETLMELSSEHFRASLKDGVQDGPSVP